jgi:hypothetical protein
MTTDVTPSPNGRTDFAARFVVRAAMMAPSVYNNAQPWSFASSRAVISVYADPVRALSHTDPAGREIVISGGAALFNLRLAMRHLGFASRLRPLPDPRRLDHLADVRWGGYSRPTAGEELLYRAMARCRTHHGRFTVEPVGAPLINELSRLAHDEPATLHVVGGAGRIRALGELVRMAELTQRAELAISVERPRWTAPPPPGDPVAALDAGVAASNGDRAMNGSGFAERHGGPDPRWPDSPSPRRAGDHGVGVVAVLATRNDRPSDWLLAGQVLQRLLLHAAAHNVSAAFHTQPLELAEYRRRIQTEFTSGAYPQLLLRLGHAGHAGHAGHDPTTSRRLVTDALREY